MRLWAKVRSWPSELPESAETSALAVSSRLLQLDYSWRLGMEEERAESLTEEARKIATRTGDLRSLALLELLASARPGVARDAEHLDAGSDGRSSSRTARATITCGPRIRPRLVLVSLRGRVEGVRAAARLGARDRRRRSGHGRGHRDRLPGRMGADGEGPPSPGERGEFDRADELFETGASRSPPSTATPRRRAGPAGIRLCSSPTAARSTRRWPGSAQLRAHRAPRRRLLAHLGADQPRLRPPLAEDAAGALEAIDSGDRLYPGGDGKRRRGRGFPARNPRAALLALDRIAGGPRAGRGSDEDRPGARDALVAAARRARPRRGPAGRGRAGRQGGPRRGDGDSARDQCQRRGHRCGSDPRLAAGSSG